MLRRYSCGGRGMCNRYANRIGYRQYADVFRELNIPIVRPGPESAPNLEPLNNIAPTTVAPIIRPVDGGVELVSLRWGLIPWFHAKGIKEWKMLTTNARWETLTTTRTIDFVFRVFGFTTDLNELEAGGRASVLMAETKLNLTREEEETLPESTSRCSFSSSAQTWDALW